MATVWVAELDGGQLVRADAIISLHGTTHGGGEARVSAKTSDGSSIIVRKKPGVSTPGADYDVEAVRREAGSMTRELVREIALAEAQTISRFRVLDYSGRAEADA